MTTTFRPPIKSRPTNELIGIKYSSKDYWQQEAIEQAKIELQVRGVTEEYEQKLLDKWQRQVELEEIKEQKRLEKNEQEGYKKLEMLEIYLTAPLIFLADGMLDFLYLNYGRRTSKESLSSGYIS